MTYTRFPIATALTLLAATALPLSAAENADSLTTYRQQERDGLLKTTKVIFVNPSCENRAPEDSVKTLLDLFYIDQYRQFHDPGAPMFMFMTNDANMALGVGGKLMLRGWFDWNGSQDSYEFFPYDISIPKNPTERHSLGASPSQTSVFLTLLGRSSKLHYMVYVQGAVKNKSFVLKKAYASLNDFTLGYAGTTFADDDALVPTVDAQGPNGQIGKSQMLGRYFHTFKNGLSVGAGVEFPSVAMDAIDNETATCRNYIPDVAALVQYSWDGGDSHVRLSGIVRNMTYRDLIAEKNRNVAGWGVQLSGVARIGYPVLLYFSGVYGRGVGSYEGDLSEGNYDLVGQKGKPGKMVAPLAFGATAGAQYNFSRKVFACVGFGQTRYLQKDRLNADEYKYGLYGCANVFWKITPRILTGIEYICGKRMNYDGQHAGANRIDAMLSFSF